MIRFLLLVCFSLGLGLGATNLAGAGQRSLSAIVADLKKGDKEKLQALQELEALGDKASSAAAAVVDVLQTPSDDVRLQATLALGKIGKSAVEPLTRALSSKDDGVRFYAVWALAFVGPPAKSADQAIAERLRGDASAEVRRKAAYALGRINADPDSVVADLIGALNDASEEVRQAASESLPKMGPAAVTPLRKALQDPSEKMRDTAARTLGALGAAAEPAIPELKALLLDPEKKTADAAADALAGIGKAALPALTAGAASDSLGVRSLALRSLHKIGVPAVTTLVDLLGAKHVDVRQQVAAVLGSMQVNDKVVVIGLGFALKDPDAQVRRNALQSLQQMGTGAKLAEPYISAAIVDIDPQVRLQAFHALSNLGVDPRPGLKKALSHKDAAVRITTAALMTALNLEIELAQPALVEGLKEKDGALKMQAAYALAQRGLQADVVLPIFIAGLGSEVASVRRQAAEAIARYGAAASKATPDLLAALDDADGSVRSQALQTLRHVGADPNALFPAMVKLLRKKEDPLHGQAAQVLFQIGPGAVGKITALLKEEEAPAIRLTCLQTLAMIGPPAKEAVPELTKALADPAPQARMAAARALGNIGPGAKSAVDALQKAEKDADANVQRIAQAALAQIRADQNLKMFQVQGILTAADPRDPVRQGSFHVVHTFPMKAGQTYTINLTSPWDNFLRLENPQGQNVAMDDDSGGNLNARIIYQAPQDGWYRIIVTTFAAGATGSYTLNVR